MKSAKKGLLFIPLVLFSLPAFSQFYYDVFGHKIAYQQGVTIYDTTGVKIGDIKGNNLHDSAGTLMAIFLNGSTVYDNNLNPGHLYKKRGEYIYDLDKAGERLIGSIEATKIYDEKNNLIGITDGKIEDSNAILFYFCLLPRYRYLQITKLLKTGK